MRLTRSLLLGSALVLGGVGWWMQSDHPTSSGEDEPATSASVSRVIDGDTLIVEASTRVRVLGIIDTPEEGRDGQPAQCGAREATAAARALLDGQNVDLIPDASQADSDAYGRLLRYVELEDGRDLARQLLSAGHATVYTPAGTIARQDAYEAAEEAGRTQDRTAPRC